MSGVRWILESEASLISRFSQLDNGLREFLTRILANARLKPSVEFEGMPMASERLSRLQHRILV